MEPLHRSAMAASKPREKLRLAERCKGPVRAFRVLGSSDHLRKHFLRPVGGVERLLGAAVELHEAARKRVDIADEEKRRRAALGSGNALDRRFQRLPRCHRPRRWDAARGIPIDVVPLEFASGNGVPTESLRAPVRARPRQTIDLRTAVAREAPSHRATGCRRGSVITPSACASPSDWVLPDAEAGLEHRADAARSNGDTRRRARVSPLSRVKVTATGCTRAARLFRAGSRSSTTRGGTASRGCRTRASTEA